ncbi:MAG: phosphatase [Candidatus Delongbacteria bacterium]|nr:MAG: phosphatase [Candidatus Delongbacteria bacterium]
MKYCDLHLHSTLSDGLFDIEKIFKTASKEGISAISITDHDHIPESGYRYYSDKYRVEYIPGIELTTYYNSYEVHVLGYYIKPTLELTALTEEINESRFKRVEQICDNLAKDNIVIDREDILKHKNPGRPHIAKKLIEKGYCKSFNDAFQKYLGNNSKYIVPKFQVSTEKGIEIIHKSGGLAFLAHPVYLKDDRESLNKIISFNIDGLEAVHSLHSAVDEEYFRSIAKENNLLVSGGSDCHGGIKNGKILIGKFKLPYSELKRIKESIK